MNVDHLQFDAHPVELGIEHIDQFFGVWMIEPQYISRQLASLREVGLRTHVEVNAKQPVEKTETAIPVVTRANDGQTVNVGMVEIRGPMTKFGSSMNRGGSTVRARRNIRLGTNDPEIDALAIVIDSPGGTLAGAQSLARDIAQAGQEKPTLVFFEDFAASAAVWVGTQGTVVKTNDTATIGSIGVFTTLIDSSEAAGKEGLKVHLITTGPFKGMGADGVPVTEDQLGHVQDLINSSFESFIQAVSRGRNMSTEAVRTLATGALFKAQDALKFGLVDGVQELDEAIDDLVLSVPSRRRVFATGANPGGNPVTTTATPSPQAATFEELEAACYGAPNDFLVAQLKAKATKDDAIAAYVRFQQQQLQEAREKKEEADKAAAEAKAKAEESDRKAKEMADMPGNDLVGTETPAYENATQKWRDEVQAVVKAKGCSRAQAQIEVDKKFPGLRQARVAEWNKSNPDWEGRAF